MLFRRYCFVVLSLGLFLCVFVLGVCLIFEFYYCPTLEAFVSFLCWLLCFVVGVEFVLWFGNEHFI